MRKRRNRKSNHIKLLIVLTILVFSMPVFYSSARFVYRKVYEHYVSSSDFSFKSDKLNEKHSEFQATNNWSGTETYRVTVDMTSKKNDKALTYSDVTYTITKTCSTNIVCSLSKTTGTIPGSWNNGSNLDSFTVIVDPAPNHTFVSGEEAWVDITAESTSPYRKIISGKIKIVVGSSKLTYEIVDSVDSPYLTLNITNASIAAIPVTLAYDPTDILLDMTNDFAINSSSEVTQQIQGNAYINSITSSVPANYNISIKFYKEDISQNYTFLERRLGHTSYIGNISKWGELMKTNLMERNVKQTREFIKAFTKAFFAELYNEEISNFFINRYIQSRIYNEVESDQRYFYKRISKSLDAEIHTIKKEIKHVDDKLLKNIVNMYEFIYYIDGLRKISDLRTFTREICATRRSKFEYSPIKGLDARLYKLIKNYLDQKAALLKEVESDDFTLNIQKYILVDNTYRVDLDYNFKVPYIYSKQIVEEVYNEGIVKEDKLIIEYLQLVAVCIDDINKGNFEKKYIVDFAITIFQKKNKMRQTFKIIEDEAIQDKIYLRLKYKELMDNKERIYELIKEGYKFVVVIDNEFKPTLTEFKKLDMFEYIIVPTTHEKCDVIRELERRINNELIFE